MQNPYNIQNVVEGLEAQGELVSLFNPMLKESKGRLIQNLKEDSKT